ncbi:MAG: (4Fe-4S)-binding protein, partial [Brevibacterium yomogidense]
PIGAILSPLMTGVQAEENNSLPYASSLCGACFDACPVKIDIPSILVHLRGEDVSTTQEGESATERVRDATSSSGQLSAGLAAASWAMADGRRIALAERALPIAAALTRFTGGISRLPGVVGKWTSSRDIPALPDRSFRNWWRKTRGTDADAIAAQQEAGAGAGAGDDHGSQNEGDAR